MAEHSQSGGRLGLWGVIGSDFRRYRAAGARNWMTVVLLTQGFWASVVYRFFHYALFRVRPRLARMPLRLAGVVAQKLVEIVTGISLPAGCMVGRGLYIGHFGPVVVNAHVRIGDNCNLSQCVTIGVGGRADHRGCPTIGDRVYIGPGAVVFGPIHIGNDVAIGAGAVVTRDAPAFAVLAGNPARTISYEGSFEFVRYDGMENDPNRCKGLEQRRRYPDVPHPSGTNATGTV